MTTTHIANTRQLEKPQSGRQTRQHTLCTNIKLAEQLSAGDDMGHSSFVDSMDDGFLAKRGIESDHCNTHPFVNVS